VKSPPVVYSQGEENGIWPQDFATGHGFATESLTLW